MPANGGWDLTLILLTWTTWRAPTNASKWRMGFNSAFKVLIQRRSKSSDMLRCVDRFERRYFIFRVKFDPENNGNKILRNVGIYLPNDRARHTRRLKISAKLL